MNIASFPSIVFVAGIDTDCGKTYATGVLACLLKEHFSTVITQKLVQTGCEKVSEDIIEHRRLMNSPLLDADREGITMPYVFKFPASPHLAAQLEGKMIDENYLTSCTDLLKERYDVVLVEGAGGLHVPLSSNKLLIDYVKDVNYPTILVTSSRLGSINHTLLSLEALERREIEVLGVIYNHLLDSEPIASDSATIIRNYLSSYYRQAFWAELEWGGRSLQYK